MSGFLTTLEYREKLAYIMRKQGSCQEKEIMQGTMPGARRRGRPRTTWMDNIHVKTRTGLSVEVNQNGRGHGQMEKVCPWCGQPSDRGRLKNRTEQNSGVYYYLRMRLVMFSAVYVSVSRHLWSLDRETSSSACRYIFVECQGHGFKVKVMRQWYKLKIPDAKKFWTRKTTTFLLCNTSVSWGQ